MGKRWILAPFASIVACSSERPPAPGLENGSFTAEVAGRTVHYEVHGSGPVLMTVPNSWGVTLEALREMYRPLEDHVTMVYFDPRGMGESGPVREDSDLGPDAVREDFESLRKHLGLEKVNAIGWSNGATNLIALAAENPDVLEAAVFLHGNASYLPEDETSIVERYPDLIEAFVRVRQGNGANCPAPSRKGTRV